MKKNALRVIQISDTHLYANQDKTLLGVNTYNSFSATIDLLKSDKTTPDLIILTGDLSQDDSEIAYQTIVKTFQVFSAPVHYVPGNHDDKEMMTRVLSSANLSQAKQIVLDQWQFILLNSQKPKAVEGYLARTELDFFRKLFTAISNTPCDRCISSSSCACWCHLVR